MFGKLSTKKLVICMSVAGVLFILVTSLDVIKEMIFNLAQQKLYYWEVGEVEVSYNNMMEIYRQFDQSMVWVRVIVEPILRLILLWNIVDVVYRLLKNCEKGNVIASSAQKTEKTEEEKEETPGYVKKAEEDESRESYEIFQRPKE